MRDYDKDELGFEEAIMSDDLFSDESDELADEFLKSNSKEYTPIKINKTNPDQFNAEQEFNVFIDMRNIKKSLVAETLMVPKNIDLLHKRIVQIHNKSMKYTDVVAGTYPKDELVFIDDSVKDVENKDEVLDNSNKYSDNEINLQILTEAFVEIDKLYHKHVKARMEGDYASMECFSKEIGNVSKNIIFTDDMLNAFNLNSELVQRDLAVFGLELRCLLVDDCKMSGVQFRSYIEQTDNPLDKSILAFNDSLVADGNDVSSSVLASASSVYNLNQALSSKHNLIFSQTQAHSINMKSLNRDYKNNVERLLKSNINWIYNLVNKRVKNFPHPTNDIRDELTSAAILGYTQGIERYKVANGNRLNTYATHYAELYIRNASNSMFNTVFVPEKDRIDILKIKNYRLEYYSRHQKKPSDTDVAEALSLSFDKVVKLDAAYSNVNTSSLNDTVSEDGDATQMDFVEGGITTDWEKEELVVMKKAFLASRMSLLEPLERIAVEYTDPMSGDKSDFLDFVSRLNNTGINASVVDSYLKEHNIKDGHSSGFISENKIKLISDKAKVKLKDLSFMSADTIESIACVNNAIHVCKDAPDKGGLGNDVVSTEDVSNVLLADLRSLKEFIGVVGMSGVKIDVSDFNDCLNGVSEVDYKEFISLNASNVEDLGYKNQNTVDITGIDLTSYENENIAIRNKGSHVIASLDVLKARIEMASELTMSNLKDDSLNEGVVNDISNENNNQSTMDFVFDN